MVVETLESTELKDTINSDIESGKFNIRMEPGETTNASLVDDVNGSRKTEVDPVSNENFPKDAVDEWPAPKQIHSFYFVKFRSYEDPQLKAKIDQADREVQKKNQARSLLFEQIKLKKSDRAAIIAQLKPLTAEDKRYRGIVDEKRKDMEPLHAALGKMRSANSAVRERGVGLCSSEEELNDLIQSLQYCIQHESNTLAEEKQMLKEIKQLEGTREKVIANSAMKAKLQDTFGQREEIQDQLKLIGGDLDEVRKDQSTVKSKIKQLEEQLKVVDSEITELQEKLTAESQKKDKALEILNGYKKQREEGNARYYEYRSLLNKAKDFAAKKDKEAVGELSHVEMQKSMSLWNSSKGFRGDYEKRILPSLDSRQLSRDGTMRNPGEKSLVVEVPNAPESQASPVKALVKKIKEEVTPPVKHSTAPKSDNKLNDIDTNGKAIDVQQDTDYVVPEKNVKESSKPNAVDMEKMKERKREEEIAKAKLAMERKKKLAEKAASKAAIRAQKEAEKKEKEREKKAKKKAETSAPTTDAEPAELGTEADESEIVQATAEAPSIPDSKQKENVRLRNRTKMQVSHPRVIPKRKKTTAYWKWVIPVAVGMSLALLVVLAYYYLL